MRIRKVLYPKTGFLPGAFAILACEVQSVEEGEPYAEHITAKGKVFSLDSTLVYRLSGIYGKDEKYGEYYKIESFEENYTMETELDQETYLQAMLTTKQFQKLKDGLSDPFHVLMEKDIRALTSVKGFKEETANKLINRFHARIDQAKAFAKLGKYGLSVDAISSLLAKVESVDQLISMVENNPYVMVECVDGIGWVRADEIAMKRGIAPDDPRRVEGYIRHFMNQRAEAGHTWCYPQELWEALSYDLKTENQALLRNAMKAMHESGDLWWSEDKQQLGLHYLRKMEEDIAAHLHRIATARPLKPSGDADFTIKEMEQAQGWSYTEEQMAAVHSTLNSNVSIITGAAGTGKSSVVSAILKLLSNHTFAQCALSGRAAARLTEVTGVKGSTIHRLLGYQMGGEYVFHEKNPLPYDIVILDEVSMVGADIFLRLLRAIRTGTKLIMLGDDGQLESIGLCNLFRDMLDCGVISVGQLTQIHRQAAKSAIITESMKVRNQIMLCGKTWVGREVRGELQDLTLEVYSDPILTTPTIMNAYKDFIAQGISVHDIQIVLPMKTRGDACTFRINKRVQAYINTDHEATQVLVGKANDDASYFLRLNDRVICTKNYYDAERPLQPDQDEAEVCPVFNGDRGQIVEISPQSIVVDFDLWGRVVFPQSKFKHLELGYALSCHKLQGSEAPYIIVGFDMSSARLLTKEWLYTAITRARKQCVLLCESKALRYCISTSNVPHKRTFLSGLLRNAFAGETNAEEKKELSHG